MREPPIGEAVDDDEWIPDGVMWPPEREIDLSEVHESLAKAVAGSRGVKFYTTRLIDVPSDASLGNVQMAMDEVAGDVCGIYLTTYITSVDAQTNEPVLVDEATRPFKFRCDCDLEEAISIFCRNLRMAGIIP
ncbi:hypothetical protein HJB84_17420 [Rhizobium sp. NZLR1b]|uniref:hypothetical protein n=1 Tax=Rhizobium sp. NZLR1b TaxID=2731099 RepID=UPI001C82CBCB|nr:hypothetical protein [Rhizobium sp. NZLR1b]MBX5171619.1 hypothetical protein [Rhizobium sp. NZLR1b]